MEYKDYLILLQNSGAHAAALTAALVAKSGDEPVTNAEVAKTFRYFRQDIFESLLEDLETKLADQLQKKHPELIEGVVIPEPPAPKTRTSGFKPRATTSNTGDWEDLINNFSDYFDNRNDKTNPKAPDFKKKAPKGTPYNQVPALWLKDAPADVLARIPQA